MYWLVNTARFKVVSQNLSFIAITVCNRYFNRDMLFKIELRMCLDGVGLGFPQRPGHLGHRIDQRAVHGGENTGQIIKLGVAGNGLELSRQVFYDILH